MDSQKEYIIPFSSLTGDKNKFNFRLNKTFFDSLKYTDVIESNIIVRLEIIKSTNLLDMCFHIEGTFTSQCDKCLDDIEVTLKNKFRQLIKLVDKEKEIEKEGILFLTNKAYEINVAPYIFENCLLSFPVKKNHREGECNKKSIDILNKYILVDKNTKEQIDNKSIDPRWEKLNTLKKKLNKN